MTCRPNAAGCCLNLYLIFVLYITHVTIIKFTYLFPLQCPFGRIVYKFDYKNVQFLNQMQTLISKINARALELDDMPQHVIDAALSTYKLSA